LKERGIEAYESDIRFNKRYLIDKGEELFKKHCFPDLNSLNLAALDIETHNTDNFKSFSNPGKDEIMVLGLSFYDSKTQKIENKSYVLSNENIKKSGVEKKFPENAALFEDELEMILAAKKEIEGRNIDLLFTYNGDNFDMQYIKERAKVLKGKFDLWGQEIAVKKTPMEQTALIKSLNHIDVYKCVRFLSSIGAYDLFKYDLENVYEYIFKEKKMDLEKEEVNEFWENGTEELLKLIEYNRQDTESTLKIALELIDFFAEIAKELGLPIDETSRATTGTMVEQLLMKKAFKENWIIPPIPSDAEAKQRQMNPIKGAFVREPLTGLQRNLYVTDFQSLYPSLIISYNISPENLNKDLAEEKDILPTGYWFSRKKEGFISGAIKELLRKRLEIKAALKHYEKGTTEYKKVFAKQFAMKILLNSFYGYLGYSRARWYCRECAESITALGRFYLKKSMEKAESLGLKVVYGDTDSLFISCNEKQKIEEFLNEIDKELPQAMDLSLEGFYKTGIFVGARGEERGAKKKYALLDEKGQMKIVGFETVRRDWAKIAKDTQRKVLELVLNGKEEEAVSFVKEQIKSLKSGKTPLSELVIYSRLRKATGSYDSIGPHVEAVKKAKAKGREIKTGSLIGYIITKEGKTISDKARLEDEAKNYDADYYIENQLLPPINRIMKALGYSEEELIHGGKQKGIHEFFG
jgi:DNA polymerase elongation subunit (family B)